MKNNDSILDKIEIAKPCSADWDSMSGDERERHCQLCQLNVFNISEMTRPEAEAFLTERLPKGRVCIKLYQRQDGTIITDNCPRGLRAARDAARRLRHRVAAAASLVFAFIAPLAAQSQDAGDKNKTDKNKAAEKTTAAKDKAPIKGGTPLLGSPRPLMGAVCPMPNMNAYLTEMREKIKLPEKLFDKVPAETRSKIKVSFSIKVDGSIAEAQITSSSGDKNLDEKVLKAFKDAAPFANLPPMAPNPYKADYTP